MITNLLFTAAIVLGPATDPRDAVDYRPFDIVYVDQDRESLDPKAREIEKQLKLFGLSGIVIVPYEEICFQRLNQCRARSLGGP